MEPRVCNSLIRCEIAFARYVLIKINVNTTSGMIPIRINTAMLCARRLLKA